jgi:hypothetical protein
MEVADFACAAALEVVDALPSEVAAELLAGVAERAHGLLHEAKILVGVAERCEEPERSRLLRDATRTAEEPPPDGSLLPELRVEALGAVAQAHEGAERERLLFEAWDSALKGGSRSRIGSLTELAPLLVETGTAAVRRRWERSLAVAIGTRPAALRELTALADVVIALGGSGTVAADVAQALDDVDRWWP